MFEQAFKNIDDVLWKEAGCTTELDYTEQTSWLLFLKYLDGLEQERAMEAQLEGKKYSYILDKAYRWDSWAAPKDKDGKLDHNTALSGDDLRDFVDDKLFPYLQKFKERATGPNTIEYKIGEIFGEIKNKITSGYNLREIIDHIDELRFGSQTEKHELSHLYEAKIKNMGNAGRNGGEYYTPRPLIRAMIQVTKPKLGERIYDGAAGSAGFLCEAFEYLKSTNPKRTTAQDKTLQERTFYGKEKKSLAYVIGIMNMILHGIEAPNIIHTNTLSENLADIQEKDRYDVVLANPPFGGKERPEVQQNFPIRTGETAFLFLQHFIKILKAGGRGGIVIKNTFLSNSDNASISLRKLLLESCNLHTILDCPQGTFQGAGVKTVVLFFEKGAPTRKIWYYQLDPGRTLGKTTPLNDDDLTEFVCLQKDFADSPKSWSVGAKDINQQTVDLSVQNPNGGEVVIHRSPQEIIEEISALDGEREYQGIAEMKTGWESNTLGNLCEIYQPKTISTKEMIPNGLYPVFGANGIIGRYDKYNHKEPQLLITCRGATCGAVNISEPESWITGNAMVVRPIDDRLIMRFLEYTFRGGIDISKAITGAAQPQITRTNLAPLTISYPTSKIEQQRIVGVLDEAFSGLATAKANAEKNLQNARDLFESYLQFVFENTESNWDRLSLESLLERGWIESHLDGNHGGDYPRKEEFIEKGVPYISANCIEDDRVNFARAKYLSADRAALLRKGIAQNNDVLFAHNATVGPVAILQTKEPKVILGTSLTYYRCNPVYILPEYLAHYMRSSAFKAQYSQVMEQSTRNQVPITKQREFFHIIPPIHEQKRLIYALEGLFDETQRLSRIYEQKLAALDELKKSLLHQAFTGQL